MKKMIAIFIALFLFQGLNVTWAAERGTAAYQKMAEYKKAQREKKADPKQPAAGEKGFWQKEAERSGFAGTAAMFGNAVSGVMPLEKPNSRK